MPSCFFNSSREPRFALPLYNFIALRSPLRSIPLPTPPFPRSECSITAEADDFCQKLHSRPPKFFVENICVQGLSGSGMLLAQSFGATVMKQQDVNSYDGQNWAWPQKTWFRERLNAVKAREHEIRRKPLASLQKATAVEAKPSGEKPPEQG